MQHVKDGNLSEMSVLFERYNVKIYNFFLKLTRDREVSQDLTQNLFYRIIKYKGSYKNEYSVKSWIYQMARNIHIDYCNRTKRKDDVFTRIADDNFEIADSPDSYTEDEYEMLERAFAELPDEQKELIVLSRYQGLKYEEISGIVNLSVPAIKVAIHRAVKQLRGIYFKQN